MLHQANDVSDTVNSENESRYAFYIKVLRTTSKLTQIGITTHK